MSRIKQVRVSTAIGGFTEDFKARFNLSDYVSKNKPAIFFGCYLNGRPDVHVISQHKALGVVVWGGSDAGCLSDRKLQSVWNNRNIHHIAISKWVSEDFCKAGIPHIYLPIVPKAPEQFHVKPLGRSIYFYSSNIRPVLYGTAMFQAVKKHFPKVNFIEAHPLPPGHFPAEIMPTIYADCFMGLRLTNHDGLSNTVIELGLMGRRCVWNGWAPNAIPWKTEMDIVKIIMAEKKKVGRRNTFLAKEVYDYVNIPDDWLYTRYYR